MSIRIQSSSISCGISQLYYLNLATFKSMFDRDEKQATRWKDEFQKPYKELFFPLQRFNKGQAYMFSDAVDYKNGQQVADFIRANELGNITEIGPWRNPNSGNNIKAWLWVYNGNKPKA